MKRTKLGDVYYVETEKGYKLYQWAYYLEKRGEFIRVFPGLYQSVPDNIEEIVKADHSYIIDFSAPKAYRKGFAILIGNYPVPEEYPLPKYTIMYNTNDLYGRPMSTGLWEVDAYPPVRGSDFYTYYGDASGKCLPERFRDLKFIKGSVDPIWMVYLFEVGFDRDHMDLFWPGKTGLDKYVDKYGHLYSPPLKKV